MHAGLGHFEADLLVIHGRSRDHDVVEVLLQQGVDVGQDGQSLGDTVRVALGISHRDEVDPVDGTQVAGVVAPHHSEADETGTQVAHQAPAFARVLTAFTMRSRSSWVSDGWTGNDRHSLAARSVSGSSTGAWNGFRRWFGTG